MKLLSYNLEKHRAAEELELLSRATQVSTLCIQEANVEDLPEKIGNLSLTAVTENNRLGLAIYADLSRYELVGKLSKSFKKTIHDIVAAPAHERLLAVRLLDSETGDLSTIASFHASPLTSLNSHRRLQISQSLESLERFGPGDSLIMAGDYNYPIFRSKLGRLIEDAGYELTFSNSSTYEKSLFRGHFDFVTSRGFEIESVRTLPRGASDHKPIFVSSERKLLNIR